MDPDARGAAVTISEVMFNRGVRRDRREKATILSAVSAISAVKRLFAEKSQTFLSCLGDLCG